MEAPKLGTHASCSGDESKSLGKNDMLACHCCQYSCSEEVSMILHLVHHHDFTDTSQGFQVTGFLYEGDQYCCQACAFLSPSRLMFQEHIRCHTCAEPYTCAECNQAINLKHVYTHYHTSHAKTLVPTISVAPSSLVDEIMQKLGPAAPFSISEIPVSPQKLKTSAVVSTYSTTNSQIEEPSLSPDSLTDRQRLQVLVTNCNYTDGAFACALCKFSTQYLPVMAKHLHADVQRWNCNCVGCRSSDQTNCIVYKVAMSKLNKRVQAVGREKGCVPAGSVSPIVIAHVSGNAELNQNDIAVPSPVVSSSQLSTSLQQEYFNEESVALPLATRRRSSRSTSAHEMMISGDSTASKSFDKPTRSNKRQSAMDETTEMARASLEETCQVTSSTPCHRQGRKKQKVKLLCDIDNDTFICKSCHFYEKDDVLFRKHLWEDIHRHGDCTHGCHSNGSSIDNNGCSILNSLMQMLLARRNETGRRGRNERNGICVAEEETNGDVHDKSRIGTPASTETTKASGHETVERVQNQKDSLEKEKVAPENLNNAAEAETCEFYKCGFINCYSSYCDVASLKKHILTTHKSMKVFPCPYCSCLWPDHNHLMEHIPAHAGPSPYRCVQCDVCFSSNSLLTDHLDKMHRVNKLFRCTFGGCEFVSNIWTEFKMHNFTFHPSEDIYTCFGCDRELPTLPAYFWHIESGMVTLICCSYCPMKSKMRHTILRHSNSVHQGLDINLTVQTEVKCATQLDTSQCKASNSKPQLVFHQCSSCDFAHEEKAALNIHANCHELGSSLHLAFCCPLCPFGSPGLNDFKLHLANHCSKTVHHFRYYKCTHCPFTSNQMTLIEKHLKEKHTKKLFKFEVQEEVVTGKGMRGCVLGTKRSVSPSGYVSKSPRQNTDTTISASSTGKQNIDTIRSISSTQNQNIDTTRSVSSTQEQNIDTTRSVRSKQKQNIDTTRSVSSKQKQNIDTTRSVSSTQNQNIDTSRSVGSTQEQNIDTTGSASSTGNRNIDTTRTASSTPEQNIDTTRSASSTGKQNIDTTVSVSSTPEQNIDTTRSASSTGKQNSDTTVSVSSTPEQNIDTTRSASSTGKQDIDTTVSVSSTPEQNIDTTRSASSTPEQNIDTTRSASSTGKQDIDTTVSVSSTPEQNIDTTRSASYTPEQNIDTTRSASYTPEQNIDTTRSDIYTPEQNIDTTRSDSYTPEQNIDTTRSASSTPEQNIDTTRSASYTPEQNIDTTRSASSTPEQNIDTTRSDSYTPEQNIDTTKSANSTQKTTKPKSDTQISTNHSTSTPKLISDVKGNTNRSRPTKSDASQSSGISSKQQKNANSVKPENGSTVLLSCTNSNMQHKVTPHSSKDHSKSNIPAKGISGCSALTKKLVIVLERCDIVIPSKKMSQSDAKQDGSSGGDENRCVTKKNNKRKHTDTAKDSSSSRTTLVRRSSRVLPKIMKFHDDTSADEHKPQDECNASADVHKPQDECNASTDVHKPQDECNANAGVHKPQDECNASTDVHKPQDECNASTDVHKPQDECNASTDVHKPQDECNASTDVHKPQDECNASTDVHKPQDECNASTDVHKPQDECNASTDVLKPQDECNASTDVHKPQDECNASADTKTHQEDTVSNTEESPDETIPDTGNATDETISESGNAQDEAISNRETSQGDTNTDTQQSLDDSRVETHKPKGDTISDAHKSQDNTSASLYRKEDVSKIKKEPVDWIPSSVELPPIFQSVKTEIEEDSLTADSCANGSNAIDRFHCELCRFSCGEWQHFHDHIQSSHENRTQWNNVSMSVTSVVSTESPKPQRTRPGDSALREAEGLIDEVARKNAMEVNAVVGRVHEEMRYHCNLCVFVCQEWHTFQSHMADEHCYRVIKVDATLPFQNIMAIPMEKAKPTVNKYRQGQFVCDKCSFTTELKSNFWRHKKGHSQKLKSGFKCMYCSYSSPHKFVITKHVKNCHPDKPLEQPHVVSLQTRKTPTFSMANAQSRVCTRQTKSKVAIQSSVGSESPNREHKPDLPSGTQVGALNKTITLRRNKSHGSGACT